MDTCVLLLYRNYIYCPYGSCNLRVPHVHHSAFIVIRISYLYTFLMELAIRRCRVCNVVFLLLTG